MKEGMVPLSEHEQRLLDQIEQALYAEDPKFASAVRSARSRSRTRRSILLCIFGVLVGLGLVLVGLLTNIIVLSVVGFVLVVGACGWVAQSLRSRPTGSSEGTPQPGRSARQAGLRTRMEDRLRKRFDES
jgi:Flp pilus assembly protein TadB